jgi:predicted NAD/FAD-binding protein
MRPVLRSCARRWYRRLTAARDTWGLHPAGSATYITRLQARLSQVAVSLRESLKVQKLKTSAAVQDLSGCTRSFCE